MGSRPKLAGAVALMLMMLLVAAATGGCAASSPAASTTTVVAPATTGTVPATGSTTGSSSPASAADRQAAETYFVAMTPVIDKDYEMLQWFDQQLSEWGQTYASAGPTLNSKAWDALGSILQKGLSREQEIVKGYEAITPARAFRKAHATLLENNRNGNAWASELIADIKAGRSSAELLAKLRAGPAAPSNTEVLTEFQTAASAAGVELPSKFIDAYTEDTIPGGSVA
jgi:hypothetical protein